jgi:hypothetical protein
VLTLSRLKAWLCVGVPDAYHRCRRGARHHSGRAVLRFPTGYPTVHGRAAALVAALVAVIAFVVFVVPGIQSSGMTGADFPVIAAIISVATTLAALVGRFDAAPLIGPAQSSPRALLWCSSGPAGSSVWRWLFLS